MQAAPRHVSSPLDQYLAAAHARFDRVLATAVLAEPRVAQFDRTVQLVDCLIETTLGLAIGRMLGALASAVRASFDRGVAMAVDHLLAAAALESPRTPGIEVAPASFGDAFRGDVRRRLLLAPRTAHPVAEAIARVPGEPRVVERVLELLADDPLPAERFACEVAEGWRVFAVLAAGQPVTATMAPWTEWVRRHETRRPAVAETQLELVAAGYITRI